MTDLPPYTGHLGPDTDARAPHPPPDGPTIPWGWMALVQIGAGALAGFLIPFLSFGGMADNGRGSLIAISVSSGLFFGFIGGGVPFMGALVGQGLVALKTRSQTTDAQAVAGGALVGSAILGLLGCVLSPAALLIIPLVIGLPSAIGFLIWVGIAWRRVPTQPEHSLN